jgi:hypothetical protein
LNLPDRRSHGGIIESNIWWESLAKSLMEPRLWSK